MVVLVVVVVPQSVEDCLLNGETPAESECVLANTTLCRHQSFIDNNSSCCWKEKQCFLLGGADGRAAEMLTRVWHSPLLYTGRNQHCRLQFCSLDVFARLVSGPLIALYCFPLTHLVVATAAAGCLTRPGITPGSGGCVCVLVCTLRGALVVVMMMAPWSQHTHTHTERHQKAGRGAWTHFVGMRRVCFLWRFSRPDEQHRWQCITIMKSDWVPPVNRQ